MDIFGEVWSGYLDTIADFWNKNIGKDDLVLIAGDTSWAMTLDAVIPDLDYLASFPGRKVLLKGNHDYWWHSISLLRSVLPYGMYAVQNDCIRIDDILVCGSRGWTTPESKTFTDADKKIYDREIIRLRLSLEEMSKMRKDGDKVVAMMHFPPFNSRFERTPFTALMSEFNVDAVVYGHLHGKNARTKDKVTIDGVDYFLTSCDQIGNIPVKIFD